MGEYSRVLADARLHNAAERLAAAKSAAKDGFYKTAANRSYYCIFNSMRAALALVDFDFRKHFLHYPQDRG
jgi:uncharacterized protein (UPF0332 family)